MDGYSRQPFGAGGLNGATQADNSVINTPHQADQGGIPLVCYACNKTPTFSDVSHLITHISSKAHLLELYNLNLGAFSNEKSRVQAMQYDEWQRTYNIDQLVRQRIKTRGEKNNQSQKRNAQKDTAAGRSGTTPNRGTGAKSGKGGKSGKSGKNGSLNSHSGGHNHRPNDFVDVRDGSEGNMNLGGNHSEPQTPLINSWQSNLNPLTPQGDVGFSPQGDFVAWPNNKSGVKYEPSEGGSSYRSIDGVEDELGAMFLKGTIYPGMGMFDAAEEEQRRKRNQRKSPAVLKQLQTNSKMVTTVEEVFDCSLNHQRTRDVYDDPSIDGSEDDGEEDVNLPPKRRNSQAQTISTNKKAKRHGVTQGARVTNSVQRATQAARQLTPTGDAFLLDHSQSFDPMAMVTNLNDSCGSMSQAQLPLHNHGFDGGVVMFNEPSDMANDIGLLDAFVRNVPANPQQQMLPVLPQGDGDGSEYEIVPIFTGFGLTPYGSEPLPGLTLRPTNPNLNLNLPFASNNTGFKSPSSLFPGKENGGSVSKAAGAPSNSFMQSTDTASGENHNPLFYGQNQLSRCGYRGYTDGDNGMGQSGNCFNPVNFPDSFNPMNMSTNSGLSYTPNQAGANEFNI